LTEGDKSSAVEPVADEVRSRLAIALDVDDGVAALRMARAVRPWFGVAKVGMELYYAAGPTVIEALRRDGFAVFCDLKLYDIPTTVRKAAHVVGSLGVRYLNAPAAAGAASLEAMVEGFESGAETAGTTDPVPLAVTVLTSEPVAPPEVLNQRVELAVSSGCRGVVCATPDIATVRQIGPDLLAVVPGIRPAGAPTHDQGRIATPADAIAAGADMLVIGRAVTEADEPAAAAAAIAADLVK
jgi:orotidine-5'-phosphate decarboxylase